MEYFSEKKQHVAGVELGQKKMVFFFVCMLNEKKKNDSMYEYIANKIQFFKYNTGAG